MNFKSLHLQMNDPPPTHTHTHTHTHLDGHVHDAAPRRSPSVVHADPQGVVSGVVQAEGALSHQDHCGVF